MTKKINPIIYRIGIKNDWKDKYIEKKQTELALISFNSIEIKEFLKTYFYFNGLNPVLTKLYLSKNSLHIFLIYSCLNLYNSKNYAKINFKSVYTKSQNFLTKFKKLRNIKLKQFLKKRNNNKIIKAIKIMSNYIKNFQTNVSSGINRSKVFSYLNFIKRKQNQNLQALNLNLFLHKCILSLQLYFKSKTSVIFTLKQLIKNTCISNISKNYKKNMVLDIIKIRKFEKNDFFKEVVNTIYRTQLVSNKAYFVANLLKIKLSQLKKLKSTNYFLYFVKSVIKSFLHKYKMIEGLKIVISGNLSKKRRAVTKYIKLGKNTNSLKINSKLNYEESTCYTKKGTFGIKIYFD